MEGESAFPKIRNLSKIREFSFPAGHVDSTARFRIRPSLKMHQPGL